MVTVFEHTRRLHTVNPLLLDTIMQALQTPKGCAGTRTARLRFSQGPVNVDRPVPQATHLLGSKSFSLSATRGLRWCHGTLPTCQLPRKGDFAVDD